MYAIAHAAGIYNPNRQRPHFSSAEAVLPLVEHTGLTSFELPLDYFFDDLDSLRFKDFITAANEKQISIFPALENFDPAFLKKNMSIMAKLGWQTIRIKMPHLGETFYGGNRHNSDHFSRSHMAFKDALNDIESDLADAGLKVAIENHQDLDAYDLVEICASAKHGMRCITWDVGNSLSTLHTPHQFIDIAGDYIANIHLKDYHVIAVPDGIALRRASLGEGFIPLADMAKRIKALVSCENVSMELAAHPDRVCRINDPSYYEHEKNTALDRKCFHDFIKEIIIPDNVKLTDKGDTMTKLEIDQTLVSCAVMKRMFEK
jgi:sugar phosphate isomerase/epimerase